MAFLCLHHKKIIMICFSQVLQQQISELLAISSFIKWIRSI